MPHIIVKLYTGRPEQQKIKLANELAKKVVEITECNTSAVSVAFEEIEPADWAETVYKPDILGKPGTLYKKPGYNPFSSEQKSLNKSTALKEYIRETARVAGIEDTTGNFNAMSWMDLELENNPEVFDGCFNRAWDELSETEKGERAITIRSVL